MSWLRPSKRPASVSLPLGPSKTYCFSTFSQGSSRRCRLSSSRNRVNSFSFVRYSLRAASHSACETIFGCASSVMLLAMVILLGWGDCGEVVRGVAGCDLLEYECGHAAGGDSSCGDPRRGCQTHWTHRGLLLCAMVFITLPMCGYRASASLRTRSSIAVQPWPTPLLWSS